MCSRFPAVHGLFSLFLEKSPVCRQATGLCRVCPGRERMSNRNLWEVLILAVGLSMDAFAVAVCKGLSSPAAGNRQALAAGVYFGGFQALMPLAGYLLGRQFQSLIANVDHWIAFVLLALIGGSMIREARGGGETLDARFDLRAMLPLAVAKSIDALAVGVTFAFLRVPILPAVCLIGAVTFILSGAGVRLGGIVGAKCRAGAQLLGGAVLILMGLKILLEHLGVLG